MNKTVHVQNLGGRFVYTTTTLHGAPQEMRVRTIEYLADGGWRAEVNIKGRNGYDYGASKSQAVLAAYDHWMLLRQCQVNGIYRGYYGERMGFRYTVGVPGGHDDCGHKHKTVLAAVKCKSKASK